MVPHKVELSVEAHTAHVALDGVVVFAVAGNRAVVPAHRRLTEQVVAGASLLEALAHAGAQVPHCQVLDVLYGVYAQAVEVKLLQVVQRVGDKLLAGLGDGPVDVGHVAGKQAGQALLGPVAAAGAADAAGAKPAALFGVLEVLVLLVDVV